MKLGNADPSENGGDRKRPQGLDELLFCTGRCESENREQDSQLNGVVERSGRETWVEENLDQ